MISPMDLKSMSRNINDPLFFLIQTKNYLDWSIFHSTFNDYAKFHKIPWQTDKKMGPHEF